MKRVAIILVAVIGGFAVLIVGAALGIRYFMAPPSEAKLLDNFYAHRATFEQLRDMLQDDEKISRLADWGVHIKGGGISKPPQGNFPVDRFQRYLTFLKEGHAIGVSRGDVPHPELNVLVWRSGFAGDSVHIVISWETEPPSRQIASFDDYSRPPHTAPRGTGWVCRHIDSNWYLCTDLWSR